MDFDPAPQQGCKKDSQTLSELNERKPWFVLPSGAACATLQDLENQACRWRELNYSSSCDNVAAGFAHNTEGVNRRSSLQTGGMRCHKLVHEDFHPNP